jgi:hypothetical protein
MTMPNAFDDLQKEFHELKQKYRDHQITEREFKAQLKSLQLKDMDGKKWTIGVQTGKWYYFDGDRWVEKNPPSLQEKKAICIYCGSENDLENDICQRCGGRFDQEGEESLCPECGSKIHPKLGYCVHCDKPDKKWDEEIGEDEDDVLLTYQVRSLQPIAFSKFFGGMGFFLGIVFGVFAGATGFFLEMVAFLPDFLQGLHGSLLGGLVFGLIGGLAGFVVFAVFGLILVLLVNVVLNIFGGIQINFGSYD